LFPEDEEADAARLEALREATRICEALIFASSEPVDESDLNKKMPEGIKAVEALEELQGFYANRGINLIRVNTKWTFRTSADLGWLLSRETQEQKKLSRAAIETLAIVAYHQPVTRAEIEDVRGVAISKGTLDVLIETGWVRLRGRRKAPGRPVTYGTTDDFLLHFGLETIGDLPGLEELKAAGMFDGRMPEGFGVPQPRDGAELTDDEDPLEDGAVDLFDDQPLDAQAEDARAAIDAVEAGEVEAFLEEVAALEEAVVDAVEDEADEAEADEPDADDLAEGEGEDTRQPGKPSEI
jgi:segregation and condensation protein B